MVGSAIKNLRKRYNVTQKDLAQWLGVSRQAISMWEANKREIKASTLNKIANVFGVSLEEVLKSSQQTARNDKEGKMFGRLKRYNVNFELNAPQAKRVAITGCFKNWDKRGIPMNKDDKGFWQVTVPLRPGRYEYKFIVDDTWQTDPNNSNTARNAFGSLNSVKELVAK